MKRWLPLLVLGLVLALVLGMGWQKQLTWAAMAVNHAALAQLVAAYPVAATAGFMATYALAVSLSIPGTVVISVAGGLLFGVLPGAFLSVISATAGAVVLFLAVRTALAERLARRFAPLAERLRPGLERDGFSFLLALRLVAIVPFFMVTLAAGLVGMRLVPFTAATFLGMIPSTLVLTSIGAGLGDILAAGHEPGLAMLLSPQVLLPLLGLGVLAMLPVAWRRRKGDTAGKSDTAP
jgi:uncharacterized membrane protein YdjX (TVP38/TMEM64 family)